MLYPQEQTSKLFDQLPPELKAAILSPDSADSIRLICERYKIISQMGDLAILVGNALLGLLSPSDLPGALTKELKIPAAKAKNIAQEINRLIFYPVRSKLAELYKVVSPTLTNPDPTSTSQPTTGDMSAIQGEQPISEDTYREIVN
ncbi:MAG: hypothetical protein AAB740_03065 [Patescibacteria group bacterium]